MTEVDIIRRITDDFIAFFPKYKSIEFKSAIENFAKRVTCKFLMGLKEVNAGIFESQYMQWLKNDLIKDQQFVFVCMLHDCFYQGE